MITLHPSEYASNACNLPCGKTRERDGVALTAFCLGILQVWHLIIIIGFFFVLVFALHSPFLHRSYA